MRPPRWQACADIEGREAPGTANKPRVAEKAEDRRSARNRSAELVGFDGQRDESAVAAIFFKGLPDTRGKVESHHTGCRPGASPSLSGGAAGVGLERVELLLEERAHVGHFLLGDAVGEALVDPATEVGVARKPLG